MPRILMLVMMWGVLVSGASLASEDTAAWNALMDAGKAATEAGDLAAARGHFEHALALARVEPVDKGMVAGSLNGLGACLTRLGQYDDAGRLLEQAYALSSEVFGASHPSALPPLNNLALVYRERGQYDRAKEILERSLAIEREHYGEASAQVAATRLRLGNVLTKTGDLAAAESHYVAAVKSLEASSDTRGLRGALADLGNLYREAGRLDEARATLERAQALRSGAGDDVGQEDAVARLNLGAATLASGKFEAALPILREGLTELLRFVPAGHPQVGSAHLNIGAAEASLGRMEQAERSFAEACRILDAALPASHPDRLRCLKNRARALGALGRTAEAAALQAGQ